jgi:hypothetical protein
VLAGAEIELSLIEHLESKGAHAWLVAVAGGDEEVAGFFQETEDFIHGKDPFLLMIYVPALPGRTVGSKRTKEKRREQSHEFRMTIEKNIIRKQASCKRKSDITVLQTEL